MEYILLFIFVLLWFWRSIRYDKDYRRRLLRVLAFADRPLYGLELRPLLGGSIGGMYVVLDRLENEGLVLGQQRKTEGERPRRFFTLTEAGRLEAEKHDWE